MSDGKKAAMEPSNRSSRGDEPSANTCSRLLQLPNPLIFDILSRLPITDLLHCRCVCKRFLCYISDPESAFLHLSRSPLCILIKTRKPKDVPRLKLANVDADGANFQVSKRNFTPKTNVPSCDTLAISACNGLLCLVGYEKGDPLDYSFYLCNPILGEFITIQPPDMDRHRSDFWGLGYSSRTNQYKILQSYVKVESAIRYVMAKIYTIGTGTWRSIGNAPADYANLPFDAFLNGALHWCMVFPRVDEFIHSFDFDDEQFGTIPKPDRLERVDGEFANHTMIGVLGGRLIIIHSRNWIHFQFWVMKEYGVKESWTRQFVIEDSNQNMNSSVYYRPMVVLSNGEILMTYDNEAILCYNQKMKQLRRTEVFQLCSKFNAIAYYPCFVSLYNVANGEKISRAKDHKTSVRQVPLPALLRRL